VDAGSLLDLSIESWGSIRKERVRQLESRVLDQLRTLAEVQKLDPTDESA
jgi:DNA-directed RNA polymerase sigma subunit (sigma70/sigma32)